MKITYSQFRKDKYFFLKYFIFQFSYSLALAALGYYIYDFSQSYSFSLEHLLLIPVAFVFGMQLPVWFHNSCHLNFKKMWMNDLVGEFCGYFVLYGNGAFRICHPMHHANPDVDGKDTHNPQGQTYWQFVLGSQVTAIKCVMSEYFTRFGKNPETITIMAVQMVFYYASILIRVVSFWLLLGPTLFIFFFVPTLITQFLAFAHLNYVTHIENEDGEIEIINKDGGVFYTVMNFLSNGAYYHKNHHMKPNLYNPKYLHGKPERSFNLSSLIPQPSLMRIKSVLLALIRI